MKHKYFEVARDFRERIKSGFKCYCGSEVFLPWKTKSYWTIFAEPFFVCNKCGQVFSTTYNYETKELKKPKKNGDIFEKDEFLLTRVWDYKCSKETLERLGKKYSKEVFALQNKCVNGKNYEEGSK